MFRMASLDKPKKLQINVSLDSTFENESSPSPKAAGSPKVTKKFEKTSSGPGILSRLTRAVSLKTKRTKSDANALQAVQGQTSPVFNSFDKELEIVFKVFDADCDGKISSNELGEVLRSLGGEISEHELRLIMEDVDTDHDGYISLNEFIDVNKAIRHVQGDKSPREDPLRLAFETFDKDGNNLIDADELQSVLVSLGEKQHTLEDCYRMISNVDKDGDGFVNYTEFQWLMGVTVSSQE